MLARLLNACHHFPGFVYAAVRLIAATSTIEVDVRPRRGSKAQCSCCGKPCLSEHPRPLTGSRL